MLPLIYQDALAAADFREYSSQTRESLSCWNPDSMGFNLIENLLCNICENEVAGAVLVFMTGWDDISSLKDKLQAHPILGDPSRVLLLACHSSMASSEQVVIIYMKHFVHFSAVPSNLCSELAFFLCQITSFESSVINFTFCVLSMDRD